MDEPLRGYSVWLRNSFGKSGEWNYENYQCERKCRSTKKDKVKCTKNIRWLISDTNPDL